LMSLQFNAEWEDEQRIRDPLLCASWARLEIRATDATGDWCLTDCVGVRSRSLRRGVYGSVFPLARWIVENWWSLLHESLRADRFRGARALADDKALRPWIQRHSLLAARGGFAMPDLTVYRDGGHIAVRCVADPFDAKSPYPVRFLRNAEIRLPYASAEAGLANFVEAVVDRLREHAATEPETWELAANWEAIQTAAPEERALCRTAATIGLDPYDPEELTDAIADVIDGPFGKLAPALRSDLAESTSGEMIATDLNWVHSAAGMLDGDPERDEMFKATDESGGMAAHIAGYERARWFIGRFGEPPVDDLEGFLRAKCGWADGDHSLLCVDGVASRISAMVGFDASGRPQLVRAADSKRPESIRFLLGRALFFSPSAEFPSPRRLLTRASAWPQRASRAFAAELLVPADSLRRRVAHRITHDEIADLSREFRVSPLVIQHQIENHSIAQITDI
jgi:hypothetical protein